MDCLENLDRKHEKINSILGGCVYFVWRIGQKTSKNKLYLGWLCVLCFRKTQISAKNIFFLKQNCFNTQKNLFFEKRESPLTTA